MSHSDRPVHQTRVLIIEDNAEQLALIQQAIKFNLPEVELISTISQADSLAYLYQHLKQEGRLPGLILLDLYLPQREDGWQTLERIKSLPSPAAQIPVVMLSYTDDRIDIIESYKRGATSYIVKPLRKAEWLLLFESLRQYWRDTVTLPQLRFRLKA